MAVLPSMESSKGPGTGRDYSPQNPNRVIHLYLIKRVPEFKKLAELRKQGWKSAEGDEFFQKQQRVADEADEHTAQSFYNMMRNIGNEIHQSTGAFQIKNTDQASILDMCMAPGGFLATALDLNPEPQAVGFSLPTSKGGHITLLPGDLRVTLKFLDITMLAADMGVMEIPAEHADAQKFLPSQFEKGQVFDLVLCDGHILRKQDRPAYLERRETQRLRISQLTLGLEHVREGGTMVVLLHKVDSWESVQILYAFNKFSSVQLFKPEINHAKESSFYLIATNIRTQHPESIIAIEKWKGIWKAATFGTEEMYREVLSKDEPDVQVVVREFGPELAKIGREPWGIQAKGLEEAPFIKGSKNNSDEVV